MRTDTDTNAKKSGGRIAAKNTTALTPLAMRGKPVNELLSSDDEGEDDSPARKRRGKRKSGKGVAAAKVSAPAVMSEYMTTKEAAAYLKLSRQYLEAARYKGDGSGPPYVKLERAVRYRKSTLDAWMAAHDHPNDKPITR